MTPIARAARWPGWYRGWNIVAVAVLCQAAANGMPINAFSLFLHDWSVALNAPVSSLQLALGTTGLVSALLAPLTGAFADRYPARWLLVAGLLGMATFHIGLSFVTERWQLMLLFSFLLPPALVLSSSVTANALVSRWFIRRLGLALGLTAFGLGMAGVILPPLVATLMPVVGWRTIWRVVGLVIVLVLVPLVILVVRDRPTERDGLEYVTGKSEARPLHGGIAGGGLGWRDVFGRKNFWLLVFTYLPMLALYGVCLQNMAPIVSSRGLDQQTAGALLSALAISQLASSLTMGMLSDRFGNRFPLFGLCLVTGIGGLFVAYGHNSGSLGAGVMLVGLSSGLWPLLAAALAREFGASACGRAFGLAALFVPAISLFPFIVAKIHEASGSYAPGLTGMAALTFVGGCACLFLRERPLADTASTETAG